MPIGNILLTLGICGIVFGSVQAIHASNINSMVAFSSAAQIGYIFTGIGLGTSAGFLAALFHIAAHAVTKSQLFLTTPRLAEVSGGSVVFRDLQGSGLRDKMAGVFFTIGAFSMIGIPIFAGFSSKLLFGMAAIQSSSNVKLIIVMLALAISSMLNAIYFIRTTIRLFSTAQGEGEPEPMHHKPGYLLPMVILTAVNLLLGLFSGTFAGLIELGLLVFS